MELYKLKDNKLVKFNGGFVILDEKRICTNPTEEIIRKAGYKDLVYDEQPEYDESTQYLVERYTEGDVITVSYEVVKYDIPEEV